MEYIRRCFIAFLASFSLCLPATVLAVDGVVLIDQNKALAGNVTPGDAPGFPVTITQPGSYRLSGNLIVPNEFTTGIVIAASAVSIDLNGFGIFGPGRPSNDTLFVGTGITTSQGTETNIAIRNGTIAAMGGSGIQFTGDGGEIINVRSHNNAGVGISVGEGFLLSGNTVSFNRFGMWASSASVVRGNVVRGLGRGGELLVSCSPRGAAHGSVVGNVATGGIVGAGVDECIRAQNSPAP